MSYTINALRAVARTMEAIETFLKVVELQEISVYRPLVCYRITLMNTLNQYYKT